ncbi:uroporphyrinogen decarboxylase family protein [Lactonifactor longoviformis]|uniref:uroporphyrinogen decarboxylase family protein n=1 Tax=Lactonifactor longoviformis TaxID=341220 RepID=UPI0036F19D09
MMTSRENCLATIYGEKADYVPLAIDEISISYLLISFLEQPLQAGNDIWGCPWISTKEGSLHKPGFKLFEEIDEWEKYVKIPDLDLFDFKAMAEQGKHLMPHPDPEQKVISFIDGGGLFLRLCSFMGFENALISLATDPESCMDLFEALTQFRLKFIDKFCEACHVDVYTYGDDIATSSSLFMNPDTYRKVIKPFDKRIAEHVRSKGMIFERHCCGKCEDVIPDFIEMGVQMWQSAQPVNNIAGILDTYQGRLAVEGGWDSSGAVSRVEATTEEIRAEVRRCLTEYKKPGFILWPSLLNEKGNSVLVGDDRLDDLRDEWEKHRFF